MRRYTFAGATVGPTKAAFTATSRSASAATIRAFLEPISSWHFTRLAAVAEALAAHRQEPVKLTADTSLWMSALPTAPPEPIKVKGAGGRAA